MGLGRRKWAEKEFVRSGGGDKKGEFTQVLKNQGEDDELTKWGGIREKRKERTGVTKRS